MIIVKATFSRDALLNVPSNERALFLALGHLADEITALNKLLLWANEFDGRNEAEGDGKLTLVLLIIRLLAGKLKEAWELLRKGFYGSRLSREYEPSIADQGKDALSNIKKYFGATNLLSKIRDTYSFHYSLAEIDASFPKIPESLHLYLEKGGTSNNLYYFAELAAAHAMLEHAKTADDPIGYTRLYEEVNRVAGWVAVAADSLMAHFISRHGQGIWEKTAEEVVFDTLPNLLSIKLPWFTDPEEAYKGSA